MKYCTFILILAATLVSGSLRAQVPKLVNYQGRVAVNGVNFNGTGQFKFALVNANGSVTYWSNNGTSNGGSEPSAAVPLTVTQGLYSLLLGDTALGANMTTIPSTVFSNPDVRLRVWFNDGVHGSQLLTPDQRLAPATYLADGTVTSASVGAAAITAGKIAAGAVNNTNITPGSLDSTIFAVPGAPNAGQVLGFNGTGLTWTAPGGGVFSLNGTNAYYNGGNVGIGTTTPTLRLAIIGGPIWTSNGWGGSLQLGNGYAIGWPANTAGQRFGMGHTNSGFAFFRTASDFGTTGSPAIYDLFITDSGNVGIGRSTPQAKLHLYDAVNSVSNRIETGGGLNSWSRVEFANGDGLWNVGTSRGGTNDFYIQRNGLPVGFSLAADGFSSRITVADFYLGNAARRGSPGRALVDAVFGGVNKLVVNFGNDWQETVIGGLVTEVKTLRITGGADLAEPFQIKEEELEKGSVVVIDAEHPGRLKRSTQAYDRRVAGIVSGANGINPGIALHQEGLMESGENVALSGRVYVEADASDSAIEPGDLLTTSNIPGRAMKVTNHARAQGAVIGKAMSPLSKGQGMVLVLVTLQ